MRGILFFCHGARQNSWREPFDAILARTRQDQPQVPVALAFLEMMKPDFFEALSDLYRAGVRQVDVIPLFLAPGSHTQRDLPELLTQAREHWPDLAFKVAPTLTESEPLRDAIVKAALAGIKD